MATDHGGAGIGAGPLDLNPHGGPTIFLKGGATGGSNAPPRQTGRASDLVADDIVSLDSAFVLALGGTVEGRAIIVVDGNLRASVKTTFLA